jgi:hypothetical protein
VLTCVIRGKYFRSDSRLITVIGGLIAHLFSPSTFNPLNDKRHPLLIIALSA